MKLLGSIDLQSAGALLARFGMVLEMVQRGRAIRGSYWGAPEAGLDGNRLVARPDTPVHSLLHEASHYVCMTPERRRTLFRDAGGEDVEENAVCYFQILLSDGLPGVTRPQLFDDMDLWGYSFRLGSARAWFEQDANDAREWLRSHRLLNSDGSPNFSLRESGPGDEYVGGRRPAFGLITRMR